MKTRLLSSFAFLVILALAFILKFYVSNYFVDILILAVACIASYETSKIITKMGKYNDKTMSLIFPCALMLILLLGISYDAKLGILYTIILEVATILLFFAITFVIPFINLKGTKAEMKTRKMDNLSVTKYSLIKALNTSLVFIYPTFLISFLTTINHFEDLSHSFSEVSGTNGYLSLFVLLFALLIPVFTDTFGYLIGGIFGGKKIAPKISPKKTWSGAIGGLVACILLSITVFCIFNAFPVVAKIFANTGISLYKIAIISFLGSILAQCGDLFESYLKRSAGIKDSGNIMPGHGGILDRFDSHIFVAPFIFIAFSIIFLLI